ncbi:MAG: tRNA (adenosine(37)-N6)-dimethylallyltransferase MiaA [Acidobacteria bacterium]|nr:MAG: tRNA (adenosine(37)-N6)-dimethylallyltransferase MiaA [Acidobacteriota bacterium]
MSGARARFPPTVAVVGPTGTGKTGLAAALADRYACRLISCDAVQVYRGLDAATAKPSGAERRHRWALVDWLPPERDADLGRWVRAAEAELVEAARRDELPVVVGGTGLYLRGLAKGVTPAPRRRPELRARLDAIARRRGVPFLHRMLRRIDPEAAARLRPGDRQRIVRALEVRLVDPASRPAPLQTDWRGPDRFPLLRLGLRLPRERLAERLDARVEEFFAAGLVDEVRRLLGQGVPRSANALKAIGYREVVAWLEEGGAPDRLPQVIELVKRNTRRYAKRQMTWFRGEPGVRWLEADAPGLVDAAERIVIEWLREIGAREPRRRL